MNVIDARPDLVRVAEVAERLQQFHTGARRFDRDDVGVERADGLDDVIEFSVTHMCVDLDIVGGGEEEATLRAQVAQLHMEPFITFHGARPQSEVKRFIQGASAIAIPSIIGQDGNREGLPTVLLEAMALGTPCVATDVTGIPEILHHEQTGLMVGQRDALELADALRRLIVDGDLRVRLAHAARRAVEERFEINRNTAQMRALFTAAMREPAFALEAV